MNICIVSREYPPETMWGGIGTFTWNLAHGLKEIGHQVDVVCLTLGAEQVLDDDGITVHRVPSVKIPFSDRTWWDFTRYALTPFALTWSYRVMKKVTELHAVKKFEAIDFPEHIGEGFCSMLLRDWPAFVRLYTPLSLIGELGLRRSTSILDYFCIKLLEKSSIHRARGVNSPSSNLAGLVSRRFRYRRPISIIYNPIDTEKFSPGPARPSSPHVEVLFVGRLEDRKGVHILARAIPAVVRAVPQVRFTLLGRDCSDPAGHGSMKAHLINELQSAGVLDYVRFADPVPYTELVNCYRAADLMVVPSLYDNSPYTCLEALACGVPVVGTTAGGMPEYISHGVNGLVVPPADPELLAEALISLAADAGLRAQYSRSAREATLHTFARTIIAAKMVAFYQQQ